jgi:hypothetical protein
LIGGLAGALYSVNMSITRSGCRWQRASEFVDHVEAPMLLLPENYDLSRAAGLSKKQSSTRFPARILRYLIPYAWMRDAALSRKQPLRICEIGVGSGQMKKFVDALAPAFLSGERPIYEVWDGFDIALQHEALQGLGYGKLLDFNADLENWPVFSGYDVVLLLHVLEHLKSPEAFMSRLASSVDPGCLILGGVPSVPEFLRSGRERRLRQKYLAGGHWCQFSPDRIENMLHQSGMETLDLTGAFALRASGFPLENFPSWFKANLFFAFLFPSWPGECYFAGKTPV